MNTQNFETVLRLAPPAIAMLPFARLVEVITPLGLHARRGFWDAGVTVWITGPGLPYSAKTSSVEDGEPFTAAGMALVRLYIAGVVTDAILQSIIDSAE